MVNGDLSTVETAHPAVTSMCTWGIVLFHTGSEGPSGTLEVRMPKPSLLRLCPRRVSLHRLLVPECFTR